MDTAENNKLIAEFMGAKPMYFGGSKEYEMYGIIECIEDGVWEKHFFIEDEMLFHTDWNWLMEVVRKIVDYCINEDDDAFLSDEYTSILETVPLAVIEDSYKVVVEFIKWYNTNKTD